jgi:iron complex outermembrane recepter protein
MWATPALSEDVAAADAGTLEEIVVTAQKRPELNINVPSSVAVLSADSLKTQAVEDFTDYMTLVPGLAQNSAFGIPGLGAVALRGMNSGPSQTSNTVGYYLDDTPFSASSPLASSSFLTLDPDLADASSLEVLKGPQGTLYGASTLGGLIKVNLTRPDVHQASGEVSVDGRAIDGGGQGFGVSGIGNVPIIQDKLAIRANFSDSYTPGYMTNIYTGQDNTGNTRRLSGRIAARWQPTDDWDIQFSYFWQHQHTNGSAQEFDYPGTVTPIYGNYTYNRPYNGIADIRYNVASNIISYHIDSVGTITNTASYGRYAIDQPEDYTGPYIVYYPLYGLPSDAYVVNIDDFAMKKWSDELRFASERIGNFQGMAGFFYTHESGLNDASDVVRPQANPIPAGSRTIYDSLSDITYQEAAVFANLTYYVSDLLDITGGVRGSHNKQTFDNCTTYSDLSPYTCLSNDSSDNDVTYLGSVIGHLNKNTSAYVRVATSYRPGGPQVVLGAPPSFEPDTLTNYEVGLKGNWLNNRLRADLAVYTMNWHKIQTQGANSLGVIYTVNAASAKIKGAELDLAFSPLRGLTFGGNLAYTDAYFNNVPDSVTAGTGAVEGDRLPFTPKWAASGTADYAHALTDQLTGHVGLTARYQGQKNSSFPGNVTLINTDLPAYATLDGRIGVSWSRYKIDGRVQNFTNKHAATSAVGFNFGPPTPANWVTVIEPRTFGVKFTADF